MAINVELLETSFKAVAPRADELAEVFYNRLFREHPQVRPMFPQDMTGQKKALIAALAMVVENLRNPEKLGAALRDLAIRHIGYGVVREQYPVVGQTLLASLAEVAGPAWNDQLHQAWADAYAAIQSVIYAALDEYDRQHQQAA